MQADRVYCNILACTFTTSIQGGRSITSAHAIQPMMTGSEASSVTSLLSDAKLPDLSLGASNQAAANAHKIRYQSRT